MIITCPSCRTDYRIPPDSLGASGRTVRCTSCGHRWFAEPEAEPIAPPPLAAEPAEPVPVSEAPASAESKPAVRSSLLGWLVLTLVVLLLAAFVAVRNEIVAQFPAAYPVY